MEHRDRRRRCRRASLPLAACPTLPRGRARDRGRLAASTGRSRSAFASIVAIGDFDSVSAAGLAAAEAAGARDRAAPRREGRDRPRARARRCDRARALAHRRDRLRRRPARPPARLGRCCSATSATRARRSTPYLGDERVAVIRGTRDADGQRPASSSRSCPLHGPADGRHDRTGSCTRSHGETLTPGRAAASRTCSPAHEATRHCRARLPRRRPPGPEERSTRDTVAQGARPRVVALVAALLLTAGCGGNGGSARPKEVVLVTHDSFAIPKQVKAAFEQRERA